MVGKGENPVNYDVFKSLPQQGKIRCCHKWIIAASRFWPISLANSIKSILTLNALFMITVALCACVDKNVPSNPVNVS